MARYMMQFQHPGAKPTLDEIKTRYGLSDDELDPTFGVVLIDPRDHTYAIRVDESAMDKLPSQGAPGPDDEAKRGGRRDRPRDEADDAKDKGGDSMTGPYSNPRIEPTGPPQPKRGSSRKGK